jgi:hypothetical protein
MCFILYVHKNWNHDNHENIYKIMVINGSHIHAEQYMLFCRLIFGSAYLVIGFVFCFWMKDFIVIEPDSLIVLSLIMQCRTSYG